MAKNLLNEDTPEWFLSLMGEVLELSDRSDGIQESLLGIGERLAIGDESEAYRLRLQLEVDLGVLRQNPGFEGEKDSSQLMRMLISGKYPPDLKKMLICRER